MTVLRSRILTLLLVMLTLAPQAYGKYCGHLFAERPIDLSKELQTLQSKGLSAYRHDSAGQWIQVKGEWLRYNIIGTSGPVRIHFFGLGAELTRSYGENQVLKRHSERGQVIVIELPGQGLTEAHKVHENVENGFPLKRSIDFDTNVELAYRAAEKILAEMGKNIDDVAVWSGNSFGGLKVAGLRASQLKSANLTQFFATAITNLENRFVSKKSNQSIESWRLFVNKAFNLGTKIGLTLVRTFIGMQKIVDRSDKVKLNGATGQYFGARQVDATELASKFSTKNKVQVFTAEKDMVVYPMMHFELISALKDRGVPVTAVLVENTNHNISKTMTIEQSRTVAKMSSHPENYEGFYQLDQKGNLKSITAEKALFKYKRLSKQIWRVHETPLKWTFGLLGHKVTYPKSWR